MVWALDLEVCTDRDYLDSLRPLVKCKKTGEMIPRDLLPRELKAISAQRRPFLYPCAIAIGNSNGEHRACYDTLGIKKFLGTIPSGIYHTWNGARYDNFFIINMLTQMGLTQCPSTSRVESTPNTYRNFCTNKRTILTLEFNINGNHIVLHDFCKIVSSTLDDFLKEMLGEGKHKTDDYQYDYDAIRFTEEDFSDDDKRYVETDVVALAKGIEVFSKDVNEFTGMTVSDFLTAGSFTMGYLKRSLGERGKNVSELYPVLQDDFSGFVGGGITYANEVNTGVILKDCLYFDYNSFYPSIMAQAKLPYGYPVKTVKQPWDYVKALIAKCDPETSYFMAVVEEGSVEYVNYFSPILVKTKQGACLYPDYANTKTCGPIHLTDDILRDPCLVVKSDNITIYRFKASRDIFKDTVESLYNFRMQYKKEGKAGLSLCIKIMLNAMYGKFLQRTYTSKFNIVNGVIVNSSRDKQSIYEELLEELNCDEDELDYLLEQEIKDIKDDYEDDIIRMIRQYKATGKPKFNHLKWYNYKPVGIAITAACRYKLSVLINRFKSDWIYCDTDSIVVKNHTYDEAVNKIVDVGNLLGEMKLECIAERFFTYGKKSYSMEVRNKEGVLEQIDKYAGISKKGLDRFRETREVVHDPFVHLFENLEIGIEFYSLKSLVTHQGILIYDSHTNKKYNI